MLVESGLILLKEEVKRGGPTTLSHILMSNKEASLLFSAFVQHELAINSFLASYYLRNYPGLGQR